MNRFTLLTVFACSLAAGALSLSPLRHAASRTETRADTLRIALAGDLMCHGPQFEYAATGKDSFDFSPVFRFVQSYLRAADISTANLETVFAGKDKKFSGYPLFNTPDEFLSALHTAGFTFLVTANNHSLDRGEQGALRTIQQIRSRGIGSAGTYVSQADHDSIRILAVRGTNVAILNYTYGTNGNPVPKGKPWMVNLIHPDTIAHDVQRARNSGAHLILVFFHFGTEYMRSPDQFQKNAANAAIAAGADIIIGSHPHVIQPLGRFQTANSNVDSGIIAWSLGNFISNQRWRYSDAGVILQLEIVSGDSGKMRILPPKIVPTWVYKGMSGKKKEFIILPEGIAASEVPFLNKKDSTEFLRAVSDTRAWLTIK